MFISGILFLQTCMITGDNPLTACHIAKELRMTRKPHTLILTGPNKKVDTWQWVSVDGTQSIELSAETLGKLKGHDLCVTGEVGGVFDGALDTYGYGECYDLPL